MQQLFKLRDRIYGRPGPNLKPWDTRALAAGGIDVIVSVNDAASVYADDLAAAGIEHGCFPMEDNAPPRPGDFEHCLSMLPAALDFIEAALERKRRILIHCTAGKDRTGLTMCYYLCRCEGYNPGDALLEVRRVRPEALSARDYEPFALELLNALTQP